jgi:hypothetical protein
MAVPSVRETIGSWMADLCLALYQIGGNRSPQAAFLRKGLIDINAAWLADRSDSSEGQSDRPSPRKRWIRAVEFLVFRCEPDRNRFLATGEAHKARLSADGRPVKGDGLERMGRFLEMGDERAAFDQKLAKRAIEENGFYRFHSKTFDPVAQPPLSMP